MSSIFIEHGGKNLQTLPPLPTEEDLFNIEKRSKRKPGKSIDRLAEEVHNHLARKGNVDFSIKDLTKDFGEDIARIYDILNVFEGLGLVTKCDINKYYWLGEEDGMIPTLRQLKTLANSENLVNIFMEPSKSDPNEKGKGKYSVQFLTGKMMMLFLILDPKEGLSKADFLKFILQNVSQKTKNSGDQRIAKVLKILEALRLIQSDNNIYCPPSFKYVGPNIEITEVILLVVDGDGKTSPDVDLGENPFVLKNAVNEVELHEDRNQKGLQTNIQESFPSIFFSGFGDYIVKDEVLND